MASRLVVWTSRYANQSLARSRLVAVGITRWLPRFKLPYELKTDLTALAPTAAMLTQARSGKLSPREFRTHYLCQLERIGAERIVAALRHLQGEAPGVVLLCYEDVTAGEQCHRRYL